MPNRLFFASSTLVFAVSLAASTVVTGAHAQTTPATTPTTAPTTTAPKAWSPYDGVINSDDTLVRCAPSIDGGYAFGRLAKGANVRVVEEQAGWVRVAMTGPSFDGWCGYVQATPTVTLSADGKTLKANGRAQVNAPNAEALFAIERSWKPIAFLGAGDEATVVSTENSNGTTWYRVALTEKASGWINAGAVANLAASTGTPNTSEPKPAPQPTTTAPTDGTTTTTTDAATTTDGTTTTDTTTPQVDPDTGEVLTVTPKVTDPAEAAKADEAARTKAVEQVKRVRFSDIDAAWTRVAKEPVESSELTELRARFLAFADDAQTLPGDATAARRRADQIGLRIEVQNSMREVAALRNKSKAQIDGVADLELAMMARQPFDAVGRLNASTVYNGDRLPLLYRLQDIGSGQTLAYIVPGPTFDLSSMLGLVVGVKGPTRYDESLRLNTIKPNRIDVLNTRSGGSATGTAAPVTATGGDKAADAADGNK